MFELSAGFSSFLLCSSIKVSNFAGELNRLAEEDGL